MITSILLKIRLKRLGLNRHGWELLLELAEACIRSDLWQIYLGTGLQSQCLELPKLSLMICCYYCCWCFYYYQGICLPMRGSLPNFSHSSSPMPSCWLCGLILFKLWKFKSAVCCHRYVGLIEQTLSHSLSRKEL